MRRSIVTGLLLLLIVASIAAGEPDAIKVLFIGNSFTYYHNMPAMLEQIAGANPDGVRITAEMHVAGGRELSEALELPDLTELVRTGGWEFVVLQEQSRLGNTNFVNGRNTIVDPESFFASTREWARRIESAGATPLLLATWLDRGEAPREWEMIGWSFRTIGRELSVPVINADLAWQAFSGRFPEMDLYWSDDLHPAPLGSLLVAVLTYLEVSRTDGTDPLEIPSTIKGALVEEDDGIVHADQRVDIGLFSKEEIAAVRAIAGEARTLKFTMTRPAPPAVPRFSDLEGVPATASDFVGTWHGEAKHYPNFLPWPGEMTLELSPTPDRGLSGQMSLTFEGSNFSVTFPLTDLTVEDGRLVFEDPEGPDGAIVRYEGVIDSDGVLVGIARLIAEDPKMGMTGEWRLEKSQ